MIHRAVIALFALAVAGCRGASSEQLIEDVCARVSSCDETVMEESCVSDSTATYDGVMMSCPEEEPYLRDYLECAAAVDECPVTGVFPGCEDEFAATMMALERCGS